MGRNAVTGRIIRRCYRMLVLVMSMAVVTGLAACISPAARADTTVNITIDPGLPVDAATLQEAILQFVNYTSLGSAFDRADNSTYLNLSGFNAPFTSSFTGTMAVTPDGEGVSVNVAEGDVATNPGNPFWQGPVAGATGGLAGQILRGVCAYYLLPLRAPSDQWTKTVKVLCGVIGGILSTYFTGLIYLALVGTVHDATQDVVAIGKAIGGAVFATGLWEAGLIQDFVTMFLGTVSAWVGAAAVLAAVFPRVAGALTTAGTELQYFAQAWSADESTLANLTFPIGPSSPSCDIYGHYGTPCGDAYSTTRALYSYYDGPLYQVERATDDTTDDIYPLSPGGAADAATQNNFCSGTTCTISKIYDQSPDWDDLTVPADDKPALAAALPVQVGSSQAYGVYVTPGVGYRDNAAQNLATNGDSEGMYMVASGTHVNAGCCFDFGNAETDSQDNGPGHMDAVNLTTFCGTNSQPCTGSGPWVEADMENGQWMGNGSNPANLGNNSDFVTAMLENDGQSTFALEGGNSQSGGLSTWWNGSLPSAYIPMKQEGAVILGTGGDNSNSDVGSFFEGAMTIGYPSPVADALIQQNIVLADYTGNSGGNGAGLVPPAGTITVPSGMCVDVLGDDTGTDGTPVDEWDCQPSAYDQHWTHNANGELETLGRCLNISTAQGVGGTGTGVAGDHLTLWDCNGSGVEDWVQQPDGTLLNPPSGLCLYGQPSDGYQLQVVACDPSDPNQQFSVNGGNPITVPSGQCMDVLGDDTGTDGTPVDIWDCQSYAVDQHYTHGANHSLETLGRCVSISIAQGVGGTGTGVAGDHLTLWDCNGSGAEEWVQEANGLVVNPPSGLCMYGQPSDGYQLQVVACDPSDPDQQFADYDAAVYPPAGTITVPGGQCVDVLGDDTGTDGTPADIWDCQPYAVDQHWTHNADGSLETLGRCLSISIAQGVGGTGTGVAGDHLTLWDCNGSGVEKWLYEASGLIVNPATGLCMYGQHSDGYQLQVVNCNITDPSQLFSVNGGSPAVNTPSGQCVDVIGDDTGGQGAAVDLWGCQSYAIDQHWTYGPNESLQTLGLCLDTVGPSIVAGALVTVADCDGSSTQQWVQQSNGSVVNVGSGLCLDDPGFNTNDGTRLQIWTCNGGTNQVFVLGD